MIKNQDVNIENLSCMRLYMKNNSEYINIAKICARMAKRYKQGCQSFLKSEKWKLISIIRKSEDRKHWRHFKRILIRNHQTDH